MITEGIKAMQSPLEIQPDTAETLTAQARKRGLSVDRYLKSLLGVANGENAASAPEEFSAAMKALAETHVTPLPQDFSRDDIYFPER
jgi:hypothetical protein